MFSTCSVGWALHCFWMDGKIPGSNYESFNFWSETRVFFFQILIRLATFLEDMLWSLLSQSAVFRNARVSETDLTCSLLFAESKQEKKKTMIVIYSDSCRWINHRPTFLLGTYNRSISDFGFGACTKLWKAFIFWHQLYLGDGLVNNIKAVCAWFFLLSLCRILSKCFFLYCNVFLMPCPFRTLTFMGFHRFRFLLAGNCHCFLVNVALPTSGSILNSE